MNIFDHNRPSQAQLSALLRTNRRHFFKTSAAGVGAMALSSLLGSSVSANDKSGTEPHASPRLKAFLTSQPKPNV